MIVADPTDVPEASSTSETSTDLDFGDAESDASVSDGLDDLFDDIAESSPAKASDSSPEVETKDENNDKAESLPAAKGAEKRIRELVAKSKEAESKSQQLEYQLEQHKLALQILKEQLESRDNRLAEIDDIDPRQVELEQMRLTLKAQKMEEELNQKYENRFKEAQFQAQVEAQKERLIEEVESAITKYPGVSKQDIAFAWRSDPNAKALDLAKQIYDNRKKVYEPEILKKIKPAPRTTVPQGQKVVRKIESVDDLIADLDASLGSDWNLRK